jgi:hypothetical protein
MSEFSETCTFFGVRALNEVNYFVLRMIAEDHSRPAWLNGKHKLELLPRWNEAVRGTGNLYPTQSVAGYKVARRLLWLVENLQGGWCLDVAGIHFETDDDLVHFRLKFS